MVKQTSEFPKKIINEIFYILKLLNLLNKIFLRILFISNNFEKQNFEKWCQLRGFTNTDMTMHWNVKY